MMTTPNLAPEGSTVAEPDRQRREEALVQTLANARLAHGMPTPEAIAIFEAWARGELASEERSAAILALPIE